jgi:hypothetical protein
MLTEIQAASVGRYLVARVPGASSGYIDHGYETAWELACDALEALGYATEVPRGVRLLPCPVRPDVFPRWDDACCVVLAVAEQLCQLQLRHSWSEPGDETGPGSADLETIEILDILGLTSCGAWTEAAAPVLWRTAPEEVRPVTEEEFSTQVCRAVADIPAAIRGQIHAIYAEHANETVRDYLVDWVFFEAWRWGGGWVAGERGGRPLGIFHDPLAQRVRGAVVDRVMGT